MFDRKAIKLSARARMRGFLGNAILVSLICALLVGEGGGFSFSGNSWNFDEEAPNSWQPFADTFEEFREGIAIILPIILIVVVLAVFFAMAYSIFLGNVIAVGQKGWFLRYSRGEYPSVGDLFASFRIYKPAMLTMLLYSLYTFLWSLLFIIPGIVKSYAYALAPYIIYENPNIPPAEALRISERMMQGKKGSLFVFHLSFFWWYLLSGITFGIVGICYVYPYANTAEAMVYDSIKWNAIQNGIVPRELFGLPSAPPADANDGTTL